jgi:hypothetical protein
MGMLEIEGRLTAVHQKDVGKFFAYFVTPAEVEIAIPITSQQFHEMSLGKATLTIETK